MPNSVRTHDFGDESVKGSFDKRPPTWKMEAGRTYRIRVMTVPIAHYGAYVRGYNRKGEEIAVFKMSLADFDTATQAVENADPAAIAKASSECPLFEGQYEMARRWVVVIHEIGVEDRGRVFRTDKIIPWAFGKDKYAPLTQIVNSLPMGPDGKRYPLCAIELQISCSDSTFQKATINALTHASQMTCRYQESLQRLAQYLTNPADPNGGCFLLDDFLTTQSKGDLIKDIKRITGQDGLAPEPGYGPQGGYQPQPGYGPQGGYQPQPGYGPQSGYAPQADPGQAPGYDHLGAPSDADPQGGYDPNQAPGGPETEISSAELDNLLQ